MQTERCAHGAQAPLRHKSNPVAGCGLKLGCPTGAFRSPSSFPARTRRPASSAQSPRQTRTPAASSPMLGQWHLLWVGAGDAGAASEAAGGCWASRSPAVARQQGKEPSKELELAAACRSSKQRAASFENATAAAAATASGGGGGGHSRGGIESSVISGGRRLRRTLCQESPVGFCRATWRTRMRTPSPKPAPISSYILRAGNVGLGRIGRHAERSPKCALRLFLGRHCKHSKTIQSALGHILARQQPLPLLAAARSPGARPRTAASASLFADGLTSSHASRRGSMRACRCCRRRPAAACRPPHRPPPVQVALLR